MKPQTDALARKIAQDPRMNPLKNVTSSWINIIIKLLPLLVQLVPLCIPLLARSGTNPTPREFLADHFDSTTGTFDPEIIARARPHTRQAVRAANIQPLPRKLLDAVSESTLAGILDSNDATVQAVIQEATSAETPEQDPATETPEQEPATPSE